MKLILSLIFIATSVYLYTIENWEPAIVAGFSQVPVGKMDIIEEEFQKAIEEILDAGPEDFDLERIGTIIDKMMLARQVKIENGPQEVIPGAIVADMLYSTKETDFLRSFKRILKINQEISKMLQCQGTITLNLVLACNKISNNLLFVFYRTTSNSIHSYHTS